MDKLNKFLYQSVAYICAALMFTMMALTFGQVVCRYVFGDALTWSEELGRYIFVWLTFLGMSVAFYQGKHVALDILVHQVSGLYQRVLLIINSLLVCIFAIALLCSGCLLFEIGSFQFSSALTLPMQYVYIVLPVSGGLLFYFVLCDLFTNFKSKIKRFN